MAQTKEYKITIAFDGFHVGSVWCERFLITDDSIAAYVGHTIVFVMSHDYTERNFGGNRTWKVSHGDEILASSAQMTEAKMPSENVS